MNIIIDIIMTIFVMFVIAAGTLFMGLALFGLLSKIVEKISK